MKPPSQVDIPVSAKTVAHQNAGVGRTGLNVTGSRCPDGGPARVLVVLDRPDLVELVTVTLNHGTCSARTIATAEQLATLAAGWQPHLLILDMTLNGLRIMQQVRNGAISGSPMSVMGLVCRADLQSKLAA